LKWVREGQNIPSYWVADLTAFQAEADDLLTRRKSP
jgi:hypothetical protein